MATSGTPDDGLDEIASRVYVSGADLTLVAYTNAADSLGSSTVAGDLTQPTASNGYAPIVLNGTWSSSAGVLAYDHGGGSNPSWSATGSWSATVNGVALIYGSVVVHFKDLSTPFVAANGRTLEIDLSTVVA